MKIKKNNPEHEWIISIQGQRAVDAGYKLQQNYCCRGIYDHGERIAQLEVVLDSDIVYNGLVSKWVDVILYKWEYADRVLKQLERLGFNGCLCMFYDDMSNSGQDDAVFFHL